jgi:hypothetical protein
MANPSDWIGCDCSRTSTLSSGHATEVAPACAAGNDGVSERRTRVAGWAPARSPPIGSCDTSSRPAIRGAARHHDARRRSRCERGVAAEWRAVGGRTARRGAGSARREMLHAASPCPHARESPGARRVTVRVRRGEPRSLYWRCCFKTQPGSGNKRMLRVNGPKRQTARPRRRPNPASVPGRRFARRPNRPRAVPGCRPCRHAAWAESSCPS